MGKITFIYEHESSNLVKEFIVKNDATTDEVLEAFAAFLVLCGQSYDDETINYYATNFFEASRVHPSR